MTDDILLNDKQAEAVAHDDGPALILSGAGSGKTRVITSRAVRLISAGVAPSAIFCVTFTNKAAGEMRDRIATTLDIDTSALWITTFHSASLKILKAEYKHLGFPSMPVVFDATDQKSLVKKIIKDMGFTDAELPHKKALSIISRYKNDMKGPEHLASEAQYDDMRSYAEVFFKYEEALRNNNAVDFDDLLLYVIKLFKAKPEVLQKYQECFSYIMVDEFQDTNTVQYKIVKLLSAKTRNIFVVGDDDQSIYRWRGAKIGNILGFENDFPNCKVIKLEENYRSTKNILKGANEVVRNVAGRKEKELWTKQESGEKITIYKAITETDEVAFITDEIAKGVSEQKFSYGDYAVFYRTNAQSRIIEEGLNSRQIPYRIYGGLKFYGRKEIKDALAYFRLAVNPQEEVSFLRAISSPPKGIGPKTIDKIRTFANENKISIIEACGDKSPVSGQAGVKLKIFYDLIKEIEKKTQTEPASVLIEFMLEESGLVNFFLEKRTQQDNSRVENLKELASAPYKNERLADYLDRVALQSQGDLVEEDGGAVSLMTIHISKGLEFPIVFMAGMEDNLFPHFNSMDNIEELDEERRLCYVGMTRAKKKLYMTHAVRRMIYGDVSNNDKSHFLDDIPPDIVENKKFKGVPIMANRYESYKSASYNQPIPDTKATQGFAVGKQVTHRIFGKGIIKKCEGSGEDKKLTILFAHAGAKKLSSKFVELVA